MTSSLGYFIYFNLNISGTKKRYLKIVNSIFVLHRKATIFVVVTLKRNFSLGNVLLYFISFFFVIFSDKDIKYKYFIRTPVVFINLC